MNVIHAYKLATALAVLALATVAPAQEISYSDFSDRLARLEGHLSDSDAVIRAGYDCDSCDGGCAYEASCSDCNCCDASCCCDTCGCCDCCGSSGGCYAEVQFNFFRAHLPEGAVITGSKLSEEYELSPRFIVGYENCDGLGGRVRYWHHGHQHNDLNGPSGIRFEWDVLDFEVTKRLTSGRHDVVLAAGIRAADVNVRYTFWDAHTHLIGGTIAADVRSIVCCQECSEWGLVYGGRLALLAGDINGGTQGLVRDMNWRVWEIYGGVEHRCHRCGVDLYSRLAFEIQNWKPDQMIGETFAAESASIGFVGPSFRFGIEF